MMANGSEPDVPPAATASARRSVWRRLLKVALVAMTVLLLLITGWVGRSAADGSPDDVTPVRDSLAFLRASLESGGGEAAQQQFPEGYFFSSALYGLAWTDLATAGNADARSARREAQWALDRLGSPAGRSAFNDALRPRYGIFYAGWSLLLRSETASLDPTAVGTDERNQIAADADAVASAFEDNLDAGGSPFLVAYSNQSWPVDSVVAIAALRRADEVTGQDHGQLIDRWLRRVNDLVDPRTGLLPHQTDPKTGAVIEGSRGSSQTIIQRMWPTVDPATRSEVYRRFRTYFVATRAGFVGVREYPDGVDGAGDVDSGPLVLGFSASASAVAIGAARANGDESLAVAILHEADVFGAPLTIGGERRYAFGAVPIGDAFLTWARATPPTPASDYPTMTGWWPSLVVLPWTIVGGAWLLVGRARRRRTRSGSRPDDPLRVVPPRGASPA
jgi:hypothetical protein